ncbi:MAG: BrnT family toxin [Anaerolineales bacterium]|nr:BrnT family toxin [Anaerolineales bacterium]
MLQISRLIWDDWNVEHIAQHAVSPHEVEEVCAGPACWSKTYNDRLRVIGFTTQQRALTVILAPKGTTTYYPVTARPASRRERQLLATPPKEAA